MEISDLILKDHGMPVDELARAIMRVCIEDIESRGKDMGFKVEDYPLLDRDEAYYEGDSPPNNVRLIEVSGKPYTSSSQITGNVSVKPEDRVKSLRINGVFENASPVYFGREPEEEQLEEYLDLSHPSRGVVVEAIGGMGKTALAKNFCASRKIWEQFDVVLGARAPKSALHYHVRTSAANSISREEVIAGAVRNTDEFKRNLAEQTSIHYDHDFDRHFSEYLSKYRVLIVIDNLETVEDTESFLAFLNGACVPHQHKALITTRRFPSQQSAFFCLPLKEIKSPNACTKIIEHYWKKELLQASDISYDAVGTIIRISRGHPLLMRSLTARLCNHDEKELRKLGVNWDTNPDAALNDEYVFAVFDHVFDASFFEYIGPIGAELLMVISYEYAGVKEQELLAASGLPEKEFSGYLDKLFECACIEKVRISGSVGLTMHPLTRYYFKNHKPIPR